MAEKNTFLDREESLRVLYSLINSAIISEDIEYALTDIAACIEGEIDGFHFWGGDADEILKLHESVRSDLMTPEYIEGCHKIAEKYKYKLSPFELEQEQAEMKQKVEEKEKK